MTRGHFTTRDGCRLDYVDAGHGLPVLWQHGLGATEAQPAEVFPEAADFRRITLECRGHAGSELGPPGQLSLRQFADDALALLDHLAVPHAVVGGISLGAAIALRLAVLHPGRVSALILARPAWVAEPAPERMRIYVDVAQLLERFGSEVGLRHLEATDRFRLLARESPDNAASMRGFFSRDAGSTVALLGRIPVQGPEVSREQISRLALPTLVIANERDYVHSLAMAEELAGLIPGARLAIIPAKDANRVQYIAAFQTALADFLSAQRSSTLPP
jgi:pimeloyl-ACP methyl ester carboxylesterase